jgi:hypothetical protein
MRVDSNQQKIVKKVALKKVGIQRFSFSRFSTLIQWKIKTVRIKQKIEAIGNETGKRPKRKTNRRFHSNAYLTVEIDSFCRF